MILYLPIEPAMVFTRTYEQELASTAVSNVPSESDLETGRTVIAELKASGT